MLLITSTHFAGLFLLLVVCKSSLEKRKKTRPLPYVGWTMQEMVFKEYENRNIEKYLKTANFVGWLRFSWVTWLSLQWVSITTNSIWLKEVHNVANKCLGHSLYKTSSNIFVNLHSQPTQQK